MIVDHKTFDLYGKMVFEKAIIKAPFSMPNPMQDEACFLYIRKGVGETFSEIDSTELEEHESILMKCGNYLNKALSNGNEEVFEAIAVHFYPDVLSRVFENKLPPFLKNSTAEFPKRPSVKVPKDDLFQKFFEGIFYYFQNPELVNEELITLKLKELLLLLDNTRESEKLHLILSSLFSQQTNVFKSVVQAHLYSDLTIDQLAAIAGQSLSKFKRTFREIFGSSPAKYIREERLSHAAELLKNTQKSISEIAFECAFNDLANFSSCFKKQFGQAPSEYRK